MFRPVVAIIRFYHSTHLRLFYTIRVAACLMRRSQHENPCWSIVPLYWVYYYVVHPHTTPIYCCSIHMSQFPYTASVAMSTL